MVQKLSKGYGPRGEPLTKRKLVHLAPQHLAWLNRQGNASRTIRDLIESAIQSSAEPAAAD